MRIAFLIFLALITPLTAWAQHHSVEISPYGAYRFGGEIDADDNAIFDEDVDIDESAAYGVRVNVPLHRGLQFEFLATRQDSSFFEEGSLFVNNPILDVTVDYYHLGLLWQWGHGQINPYLVSSLGIGRIDIDVPSVSAEEKFSWSFGGGVKIMTTDHVGLRIENRWFWTNTEADDDDDDCWDDGEFDGDCLGYTDDLVQGEVSVGILFTF